MQDVDSFYKDVVLPPPSFRQLIDKTAEFIKEHGLEYVLDFVESTNTFESFPYLEESHPYHEYLLRKVLALKQNIEGEVKLSVPAEIQELREAQLSRTQQLNNGRENLFYESEWEAISGSQAEKEFVFSDLDFCLQLREVSSLMYRCLHLCARYLAMFGMPFIAFLLKTYGSLTEFCFLDPKSEYNNAFLRCVALYKSLMFEPLMLAPWLAQAAELPTRQYAARLKLEQEKTDACKRKEQEETALVASTMEGTSDARFYDFEVVAEVRFTARDEEADLPPIVLSFMADGMEEQVEKLSASLRPLADELRAKQGAPGASAATAAEAELAQEPAEPQSESERRPDVERVQVNDEEIVIVRNYRQQPSAEVDADRYVTCPLTQTKVMVSALREHLRTVLADKKWRSSKRELLKKSGFKDGESDATAEVSFVFDMALEKALERRNARAPRTR